MLPIIGQALNIVGFTVLFFNSGFILNFSRLESLSLGDEGFKPIQKKEKMPKALNILGFLLVILGSGVQLLGSILSYGTPS